VHELFFRVRMNGSELGLKPGALRGQPSQIQDIRMNPELSKSTVYFDGSCPLCRMEIGYYRRKDRSAALDFVDVSETGAVIPEEMSRQRAMQRFHVRSRDGRVISGAAAFIELWTCLPGWRWAARAASLPAASLDVS